MRLESWFPNLPQLDGGGAALWDRIMCVSVAIEARGGVVEISADGSLADSSGPDFVTFTLADLWAAAYRADGQSPASCGAVASSGELPEEAENRLRLLEARMLTVSALVDAHAEALRNQADVLERLREQISMAETLALNNASLDSIVQRARAASATKAHPAREECGSCDGLNAVMRCSECGR